MTSNKEKKFWLDFFEVFRQLPQVWDIKSEIYKNKVLKKKAYEVLLDKYKEIDSHATMDVLKRKLNNFRTCYRRELKKVNRSCRSRSGASDVYVPNLWYYDALDFLKDQQLHSEGISSTDLEEKNVNDVFNESSASSSPQLCSSPIHSRKRTKLDRNQVILKAVGCSEKKDEADIFAEGWATCFRKLDPKQQLFANKTIHEVLFQAALGKLTEYSHKAFDSIEIESGPSTSPLSCTNRSTPEITSPTPLSQLPSKNVNYLRPEAVYPMAIVRAGRRYRKS